MTASANWTTAISQNYVYVKPGDIADTDYFPGLYGDINNNTIVARDELYVESGFYIFGDAGNDSITLTNGGASPEVSFLVSSGGYVDLGEGDDTINYAGASITAGKAIELFGGSIALGSGKDTLTISNSGLSGYGLYLDGANGATFINFGSEDDTVTVTSAFNALYLYNSDFNTASGNDTVKFTSTDAANAAAFLSYGSVIGLGGGDDSLEINSSYYGIDATYGSVVNTGVGNDTISINSIDVGIYLSYGAAVLTGKGIDQLNITTSAGYGIEMSYGTVVNLGAGVDTVNIDSFDSGVYMSDGAIFTTGAGNDIINITSTDNEGIYGYYGLIFDTGTGSDVLTIESKLAGIYSGYGATYTMGTGADTVTVTSEDSYGIYLSGSGGLFSLGAGDDTVESESYYYNGFSEATFDAGTGNDSLTFTSTNSSGLYVYYGSFVLGSGTNTVTAEGVTYGIYTYYSTITGENGVDKVIGKTVDVASTNSGMYLYSSSVFLGGGNNLISGSATGTGDGVNATYTSFVTDGGNDVLRGESEGGNGLYISSSTVDLGDGDNLFKGEGLSYGTYFYDSGLTTGDGVDTVVGVGINDIGLYISDSSITTGAGGDFVTGKSTTSSGLFIDESMLNTGDGSDTLFFKASGSADAVGMITASILTGAGDDRLTIVSNAIGLNMDDSGINTGDGNDIVDITGTFFTAAAQENAIQLGNGDDTLIGGRMAIGTSDVIIAGGQGNDVLKLRQGKYTFTYDQNTTYGQFELEDSTVTGSYMLLTGIETIGGVVSGEFAVSSLTTGATLTVNSAGNLVVS